MKIISFRWFVVCIATAGTVLILSYPATPAEEVVQSVTDLQDQVELQMNKGWVDSVGENDVVIDDMSHPFSSLKVYDQKGFAKENSSLTPGRYVAFKREEGWTKVYLLDESGERPKLPDMTPRTPTSTTEKNETLIRHVDGVWKN